MAVLEFFHDFSSPFAYLGSTQVERLAAGHTLIWRPFLLGALFKSIGTPLVPLETFAPPKLALVAKDQLRWAEHWGVEFRFPSRFPQRTVKALRAALAAPAEQAPALTHALYRVAWVDDGDLDDAAQLARAISSVGLDGQEILARAESDEVKAALRANTDRAVALGLCGAPSYVVGELVFWGQDRQEFVKKALEGWVPRNEGVSNPG